MTRSSSEMRRFSVAQAKAQLSALLDAVEHGEAVEITRRGKPVARLIRPEHQGADRFNLAAFLAETTEQPLHPGANASDLLKELREDARY